MDRWLSVHDAWRGLVEKNLKNWRLHTCLRYSKDAIMIIALLNILDYSTAQTEFTNEWGREIGI